MKQYMHEMLEDKYAEIMMNSNQYKNSLEQQLANLKHNYEMQKIMIADYKKRIEELEAPRSCDGCKHYDKSIFYRKGNDCRECSRYMTDYYEPKDK